MEEWENRDGQMHLAHSHPEWTWAGMDQPAQENTLCGFNKASLNLAKSSRRIKLIPLSILISWGSVMEEQTGGEWFHSCTFELPYARWAGPSGKNSDHTRILVDRSNETEALSFFLRTMYFIGLQAFLWQQKKTTSKLKIVQKAQHLSSKEGYWKSQAKRLESLRVLTRAFGIILTANNNKTLWQRGSGWRKRVREVETYS